MWHQFSIGDLMPPPAFPKPEFEARVAYEVADKHIPSISYTLVNCEGRLATGHIQRADLSFAFCENTRFRIASLTKMFTAICTMQLAARGLVDLDADVAAYLPSFTPENPFNARPVTLRRLLSHTAGVIREPKTGHYLDDRQPSLQQIAAEVGETPLKLPPGEFSYSNAGIAVVGAIIEQASGQDFVAYLQANILEPLGMEDTSIRTTPAVLAALAPARMWNLKGDTPAPVFDLAATPAGNIFSSLPDMERFMRCLLNNGKSRKGQEIVRPADLRRMWQLMGRHPNGVNYGMCFTLSDVDGWQGVGHGGAIYGFASQLLLLPKAGLGALVISTLDGSNATVNHLAIDGLRMALAAQGKGQPPALRKRFGAPSAADITTRGGRYTCKETGESVEIVAQGPRLYLLGDGMPLQIKPNGKNRFAIDGRLFGEGAHYPHLKLVFLENGCLEWHGRVWEKGAAIPQPAPADIAPHLGQYGPRFNPAILSYENGKLTILMEYFYSHTCTVIRPNHYKMYGSLYPDEVLKLGAQENGQSGICVGPMFLARL
jgi:D-alanyl-D-alanine dipeptidase